MKLKILLLATLVAGCTAAPERPAEQPRSPQPKPESAQAGINLSGYSREFREGYADGCASARGSIKKDEARFKTDTQYSSGWKDGMGICAKR